MNFLTVRGVRIGAVSYASSDHCFFKWYRVEFPLCAWVILWTGQCFLSPLSLSNQSNKWSTVSSVAVIHKIMEEKHVPCPDPNVFSCFCCSLFCFTLPLHVNPYSWFPSLFFHHCCPPTVWSECAVHTDEVSDPSMSCSWFNVVFVCLS